MKILFVHKQILYPRDTGGKIRVLNVLKHLTRWHDVTYVSNLRRGEEPFLAPMRELGLRVECVHGEPARRGGARFYAGLVANLLSDRPFSIDRNYDPRLRDKIRQLISAEQYDLLICDTVQMARHTVGLGGPPQILFQHNVEAQILRRHAEVGSGRFRKWYMGGQWQKMRSFERRCGQSFDAVIAVSQIDKQLFEADYGWSNTHAIDTAVDLDFFVPDPAAELPDRVLFLGSMDWLPNQDGVKWFLREVWPVVRAERPRATFHVVGRNPPADIRSLASVPGVTVVGGVPDVRPHLAEASVFVVPLLVGGGTRLKIYEGMAMGRAVVSTAIGAEGLPVVSGVHYLAADSPEAFAAAVTGLLGDPSRRRELGLSGQQLVRQKYGAEPVAQQFAAICESVASSRRTSHQLEGGGRPTAPEHPCRE